MLDLLEKQTWENLSHWRVCHFGYWFIYGKNTVNSKEKLNEIPSEIYDLMNHSTLKDSLNIPERYFDQITINEYLPGSGIASHCDSHAPFEEPLVSISLLSDIVMTFYNPENKETFGVVLPRKSALLLTGKARYLYEHQINEWRVDWTDNGLLYRKLRISLTFRRLKI